MKSLGNLQQVDMDLTAPLPIKSGMTMNQLTVLIGPNGTGKTFYLINSYCLGSIMASVLMTGSGTAAKAYSQFVYDNCFKDQNINGKISATYQSGAGLNLVFEKGQIKDLSFQNLESYTHAAQPIFMSSGMRLFTPISQYLKLRKRLNIGRQLKPGDLHELLQDYTLYDISYIESLIASTPITITPQLKSSLEEFDITENITSFDVDLEKSDFYVVIDDQKKYMTTYGSGHQAAINMLMGASIGQK